MNKKFIPAMYMLPCEIEESHRLRKKIENANTISEIEMYERKYRNLLRIALIRYKHSRENT